MSFVVLDTDVASASFLGRLPTRFNTRLATVSACITFVTLGELTKWTEIRSWGTQRRASLEAWRHRAVLLKFDERVAVTWGHLQARPTPRPSSPGQ